MQGWSLMEKYPAINPKANMVPTSLQRVPSEKTRPIRVVFDSSAEYQGKSLNSELLTGPNLRKTPLGVIVRFRREE